MRGGLPWIVVGVAVLATAFALRLLAAFYVSVLWFESVGYGDVYWRRVLWSWGAQALVGVLVAVFLFLNLRLVVRSMRSIEFKSRLGDLEIMEQLPKSYALAGAAALSALMGWWFGAAVVEGIGITGLLALTAPPWGVRDPVFALDLAFYTFQLPLLRTGLTLGMFVIVMVFLICLGGYAAIPDTLKWGKGSLVMVERARVHLGALVAAFLGLVAARLWLGRYLLLLNGTSDVQGIFGYTDAEARLPALQLMTMVTLAASASVLWGAIRNRAVPVLAGLGAVAAGGILGVQFYPSLVQRFRVEPNELSREAPYIDMNLAYTRLGFGVDEVQPARFHYEMPTTVDWDAAAAQFAGLPVWSGDPLLTAVRQLEARFPYYDFSEPVIDRYPAADGQRVVTLAVREVDPTGIEDQNWQNLHLRQLYLSGMGAVAVDAADRTPEGQPIAMLSNIPPVYQGGPGSPEGLRLARSAIYFGARPQPYAVLNPSPTAFLAPDSTPGTPGVDFPEGVLLSSPLRTLAFAWELRQPNLVFASEVGGTSRMVIHREVRERVEQIFPHLRYPEPPYPVVHEGRVVWVLDGFTANRSFPLSTPYELEVNRAVAYVRNSARVVVDAVTGDVAFYRMPGEDPLLAAYDRAFPGLFRAFDELPAALREHLRYPRRLLSLQAEVLTQYHQESAQQFHAQSDVWTTPTELGRGESPVPYQPEYGLWRIPGEEEPSFVLATVFVPAARQNLTALLAGRVGVDGRRELFLYHVAVEDQAPGPRQVEALVEQDPVISQQLSLWRSGGSQVWTGHLHVVPVGNHLLYMEALYLAAASDAIPELRRFIVSDGVRVAMEATLEEAVAAFSGARVTVRTPAGPLPVPAAGERWPAEALELLRRAEARLRQGDWPGFGTALQELEDLLERLNQAPPSPPGTQP
jgi:uncharacterized membrane protein (UPF0182 family)